MASASNVRAGGAFIEIFAKDGAFQQGMTRVQNRLRETGKNIQQFGTGMALAGGAIVAPMLVALRGAAGFENALLDAQASAGLAAEEVDKIKKKAMELSRAGIGGPAEIAQAFTALVKAGMPLEAALDGAAEAVIRFAKNAGIDTTAAAETASDAMNIFGVSAVEATDILKAAADSSSTSVEHMVMAFAQSSAVAGKLANQDMKTLAAAIAIMAQNGVKGSDAGTSLKTMMLKLVAPTDTAAEALQSLGLSANSFRGADGKVMPLADVLDVLNNKLAGLSQIERDQVMAKLFGTDAIRAGTILLQAGASGLADMEAAMQKAGSNADAFKKKMGGITGAMVTVSAAVERFQVAFADALGSTFIQRVADGIAWLLDAAGGLVKRFPAASAAAAALGIGLLSLGTVAVAMGIALQGMANTVMATAAALRFLAAPAGLATAAVVGGVAAMVVAARQLSPVFREETDGIMAALASLDFQTAWDILRTNVAIALVQVHQQFANALGSVQDTVAATSSFIGDKLAEGLDRFLAIFGADILTLQAGLEKLGLYFRSAFDFSWATGELNKALKAVDDRIEREREKARTPDERAAGRTQKRRDAADDRQRQRDQMNAGFDATVEELRNDLERAHDRLKPKPEAEQKKAVPAPRPQGRQMAPAGAAAAAPEGGMASGAIATLAADVAGQLGAGPSLTAAEKTASATARTADATEQMAGGLDKMPAAMGQAARDAVENGLGNLQGLGNEHGVGNVNGLGNEDGVAGRPPAPTAAAPPPPPPATEPTPVESPGVVPGLTIPSGLEAAMRAGAAAASGKPMPAVETTASTFGLSEVEQAVQDAMLGVERPPAAAPLPEVPGVTPAAPPAIPDAGGVIDRSARETLPPPDPAAITKAAAAVAPPTREPGQDRIGKELLSVAERQAVLLADAVVALKSILKAAENGGLSFA